MIFALDMHEFSGLIVSVPITNVYEELQLDEQNVYSFDLLGHSMGGMIAQQMHALAPDRIERLILYGTGPIGKMPGRFEPIEESIAKLERPNLGSAIENAVSSWFLKRHADPDFDQALALAKKASFESYQSGLLAMNEWNFENRLNNIKQRTLVIWGDKDRSYIFRQPYRLWCDIPNASLAVIPDSAHNVHLEKPGLFNCVVKEFLSVTS